MSTWKRRNPTVLAKPQPFFTRFTARAQVLGLERELHSAESYLRGPSEPSTPNVHMRLKVARIESLGNHKMKTLLSLCLSQKKELD